MIPLIRDVDIPLGPRGYSSLWMAWSLCRLELGVHVGLDGGLQVGVALLFVTVGVDIALPVRVSRPVAGSCMVFALLFALAVGLAWLLVTG